MTVHELANLRADIEDALRSTDEMATRLSALVARLDRPDRWSA